MPRKFKGVLMKPQTPENRGWKTLVLDLDETLVHSTFRMKKTTNIEIQITLNGKEFGIYV